MILLCQECGKQYEDPKSTVDSIRIPQLCDPCDKIVGAREMAYHLRNYGPPVQRSEAQKNREPF